MATRRAGVAVAGRRSTAAQRAETYLHDEQALLRPEVGTQAQFKKRKPPKTYRYDSSLSPALDWDGQNPARELGEWLLAQIEEAARLDPPHRFSEPRRFGDVERRRARRCARAAEGAERAVPRLGRQGRAALVRRADAAALRPRAALDQGDPRDASRRTSATGRWSSSSSATRSSRSTSSSRPTSTRGGWVNRMILGDSLVVMNSLLEYEGLGGQVQMIYIDPPYGVKFGSNFQPFVRKRDVKNNDDDDMTREPEMVQGVPGHLGARPPLVPDLPPRPAARRPRPAHAERERVRPDLRRERAPRSRAPGRGLRRGELRRVRSRS